MHDMIALLAAIAAASTPTLGCAEHAEPSPPVPTADSGWTLAGPVAWAVRGSHGVSRRGGVVMRKAGMSVDAGEVVTLRVLTPRAGLVYRQRIRTVSRWQDADRVLRVRPCPPDHENFSDAGTVGPRTGFPGLLIADRRK